MRNTSSGVRYARSAQWHSHRSKNGPLRMRNTRLGSGTQGRLNGIPIAPKTDPSECGTLVWVRYARSDQWHSHRSKNGPLRMRNTRLGQVRKVGSMAFPSQAADSKANLRTTFSSWFEAGTPPPWRASRHPCPHLMAAAAGGNKAEWCARVNVSPFSAWVITCSSTSSGSLGQRVDTDRWRGSRPVGE
jgi:hypothetical protein